MSRCGKTEHLEALVMRELTLAQATELELHATRCAVCHHELNWLKSERVLFEHRLAREQVAQLWDGFARAARRDAPPRHRAYGRWALAIAASALVLLGVSAKTRSAQVQDPEAFEASMSLEEMSRDTGRECSQLRPGMGFACGPYLPASFAQRE